MIITSPNSWRAWAKSFPAKAAADAPYTSPFRVVNKGSATTPAEILIYDQIGRDFWSGEGIAANDFAGLLNELDPNAALTVGINSPGGSVWDGLAIYNMLAARGNVTTRNDGMAASIASIILQAGTQRTTNAAALVMIHKAWGLMVGNADDAAQFQKELAKHDQVLAEIYSAKTGQPLAEVEAAMSAETFYTGNEALAFGLVDSVIGSQPKNNLPANAGKPGIQASAAGNLQPNKNTMNEPTPAPAAQTPPVASVPAPTVNFDPVIAAINALGDRLPKLALPGTDPVGSPRIENLGNPLVEKFNAARYDIRARAGLIRNHNADLRKELITAHRGGGMSEVFASNTVDSSLANTILSADFITTMRSQVGMLGVFTHKVEIAPLAPRDTIKVELVSSAGSVSTNPSNFETGDTTSAPITVSVNHYSRSFHASLAERNVGLALAAKGPTNAKILCEGLMGVVTALLSNANYGADNIIGAASSFDRDDLAAILRLDSNIPRPTIVLHRDYYYGLLPTNRESFDTTSPGTYWVDGGIWGNNYWVGGATDIVGLLTGPDAIVWGSAPAAELPSGEFITSENIPLDCGIVVQAHTWFSRSSRALWGSFGVCFGAEPGDKSQGKILTSQ